MKVKSILIDQKIVNIIQRFKDAALRTYGNDALQDAVDIQMWLQGTADKKPDKPPKNSKKEKKSGKKNK